jgi:hypothetical protein
MERTYTYQFGDEYGYEDYDYTVYDYELKEAIACELYFSYFSKEERLSFGANQVLAIKNALVKLTNDNDNWEDLAENFESELKEYFEDNAYEEYKDKGVE